MAQKTSALWKSLWNDQDTKRVFYFDIAGVIYGEDQLVDHSVHHPLFDEFSIGNASMASLSLTIAPKDSDVQIPRGAKIKRYVKLVKGDQESESLQKGEFYINRRQKDGYDLQLEAFDPMRKADNLWEPEQDFIFPMKMVDAVEILAGLMGVEVDERNEINPDFVIDYPDSNTTMRDVLCWIAAANGGNFIISDEGKLLLVKIKPDTVLLGDNEGDVLLFGVNDEAVVLQEQPDPDELPDDYHYVGQDITKGFDKGKFLPISRVTLYLSDDQVYTAGDDSGTELTGRCLYANQAIVEYVYNAVKGFVYQMYEADDANIDLSFELGDGVSVDGMVSIIADVSDDGSGFVTISAPGETESVEEYPVGVQSSYTQRNTNREIAKTRSEIKKSNEELVLLVEDEVKGAKAEFKETVDSISISVSETQSDGTHSYAEISLTVDGITKRGRVNILGDVNIDGALVANALYSVSAYFNDVTASNINSSDKISRFINGDTSDIVYMVTDGDGIRVILGRTTGSYTGAYDNKGNRLYWSKDPTSASIKDGWYYDADGNRYTLTTNANPYAVSVYVYDEDIMFSITADKVQEGYYQSLIELSSFDKAHYSGNVKGQIRNDLQAFNMFIKPGGTTAYGIFLGYQSSPDMPSNYGSGSGGQVIVKGNPLVLQGLATTASIDFSGWDSGTFSETLSDGTVQQYSVAFDDQGRPTEIALNSGISTLSTINAQKNGKETDSIKISW